jgi:hypothetical protein
MTPDIFQNLKGVEQMEVLFEHGRETLSRIFLFYNIKLYILYDFFVEVWYQQSSHHIDRIQVLKEGDVLDIYEKEIRLEGLNE